jgi:secreted trypsin-like serine protease
MAFFVLCLVLAACGAASGSVIGGSNANIANHPWVASLRNTATHVCGAVLIGNTRAVTAAHCGGSAVSAYAILAGTSERTVQTCATCALRNPVLSFVRHPDFANNPSVGYPNDVAVVGFYSIASNVNIKYSTLASADEGDFVGQECVVAGWGRQTAGGAIPTTLQEGKLTVISHEACQNTWGAARISDNQICARDDTVSVCGGDNGGPLVCADHLAGIFSWGEANCNPNFAAVFVRVSAYRDWILSV